MEAQKPADDGEAKDWINEAVQLDDALATSEDTTTASLTPADIKDPADVARALSSKIKFGPLIREEVQRHAGGNENTDSDGSRWTANYEESAEQLRQRFGFYKYDIVAELIRARHLLGTEIILDVGTADGKFLHDLATQHGHQSGTLLGLEMHPNQYRRSKYWTVDESSAVGFAEGGEVFELRTSRHRATDKPAVTATFFEGTAVELPFDSGSVDVVSAMFMLYHLKQETLRHKAISEMKRVLKPEGEAWVATSGIANKLVHRPIETDVARYLGIEPPEIMNAHFTTEMATRELPQQFEYVYMHDYKAIFAVDSVDKYIDYIKSLVSMRDQFRPIPSRDEYGEALNLFTKPLFEGISSEEHFADFISRSVFVCSDVPKPELGRHLSRYGTPMFVRVEA